MDTVYTIFLELLPSTLVAIIIYSLFNLTKIAKKGGKIAIALGIMLQMFIPDPKVQQTIEMVVKQKECKMVEAKQQGDSDDLDAP